MKEKINKEFRNFIEKVAEEYNFNPQFEYDENGKLYNVCFEKWTDQGEDWIINFNATNIQEFVTELKEIYESFDINEDAKLQLQARGNPGPLGCVESAKEKEETLEKMSIYANKLNIHQNIKN